MKRSDIEIMAPVGSYESLAAAIRAGADAVYFGVGKLNMRSASAANFTLDDLGRIVTSARKAGVKTYLTVNTIVYEDEIADVHAVIDRAKKEGVSYLFYVPEEKKRVQELLRLTRNTDLCTPVHFDFNHERIVVEKKQDNADRFQIKCYF